jgi:hypothetical protein
MKPPRPLVTICARTVGSPSIVKGFVKRRWITAVPLARSAGTVLHALPPPAIGSIARAVAGLPPLEFIRNGRRCHMVALFGCRRSQLADSKCPPPGATSGHVCVSAMTLPLAGALPWPFRYAAKKVAA